MFKVNNKDTRMTSVTPELVKSYEAPSEVRKIQAFEILFNFFSAILELGMRVLKLYTIFVWKIETHTNHEHKYNNPVSNYMFKVKNRNTRKRYEICSKLTIKTPGVFLVSLLLTLNIFHTLF